MDNLPRNNQALRNKKLLKQQNKKQSKKNKKHQQFLDVIKGKSDEELLQMADECHDAFEEVLSKEKIYDHLLQNYADNVKVLDAYSDYLVSKGDYEKATPLILKSIELCPDTNGHKYLNYAETLKGQIAVDMYNKGIEVLRSESGSIEESKENVNIQSVIASALASIAELHMTPPLWDEENAEQNCETALLTALEHDNQNIDALQCLANLRIMRAKDSEALLWLEKVVDIISTKVEAEDYTSMPPYDFRMQTARLLIELQNYKKAVKPLDLCIKEDDTNAEAWYLLSFWMFNLKKYQNALECANNSVEWNDE